MPWARLHLAPFHHQPPPPQPPTSPAHNAPSSPMQFISAQSYKTMGSCNSSSMFMKERQLLSLEFKPRNKAEWDVLLGYSERLGLCVGNLDFVAQTWQTYTKLFSSQLTTCDSLLCCGLTAVQAFGLKITRPRGLGTYCDPSKSPSTKTIWNPKAVFSPRLYLSFQVHICSSTNHLMIPYNWTGKTPMDFSALCPK